MLLSYVVFWLPKLTSFERGTVENNPYFLLQTSDDESPLHKK